MAVELWAARLDRPLNGRENDALLEMLPPERRERLARVRDAERWREPLCAYAILRRALWEKYRWRELPEIALTTQGKPEFPAFPEVCFNLSHTPGAVLVGLSNEPLGVDIEKIRPVSPRAMKRLADAASEKAFFQSWVRREARFKRSGAGVSIMREGEAPLQYGEYFYYVETFPGYVAGVATRSAEGVSRIQKFSLEQMV
ncbi:4'-phosphopantetheinyl transferase Sfp [bioreactor metagenome]|uniref:4'-phosphopantetheinyl transferase Sfp n=1 Tax=bioreactor metagenome TaxID=1076179 RepID=A0A645AWL0_9ZZZZ